MRKLAILFLLLASCFMLIPSQGLTADFAPVYMWHSPYLGKITMPGAHCRHEAIFCALVAEERFDVRIAYGWPSGKIGKGEAHSQAQAKVGESWVWLTMVGRECEFGSQDLFDNENGVNQKFLIERYYTTTEWVALMTAWAIDLRVEWILKQDEEEK